MKLEPMNNEICEMGFTFKPVKNASGQLVHGGTERIGDRLIFSGFPEMIYNQRGHKIVDLDPIGFNWFWDNNPFVLRDRKVKSTVPLQMIADKSTFHDSLRSLPMFTSIVDRMTAYFSLESTIRHPKLYKYEDIKRKPNKVIITTQGNNQGFMMGETAPRTLPDYVIEKIVENYKDFEIVQIGGRDDKRAEGTDDRRGLPIWKSVREVAESMIYIGVNTGVFHIASAYPHISKKLILCEYNENALTYYLPLNTKNHHSTFLYHSEQFYNVLEKDVGVTYSFNKI